MPKASGMVGAVCVFWLSLAGCNTPFRAGGDANGINLAVPVLSLAKLVSDGQVYYAVSVEQTSFSLQDVLTGLGLPATVTKDESGAVRIVSSTPKGERFTLVLRPEGASNRTRVAVEWDSAAERKSGLRVLLDLEANANPKKAGAQK